MMVVVMVVKCIAREDRISKRLAQRAYRRQCYSIKVDYGKALLTAYSRRREREYKSDTLFTYHYRIPKRLRKIYLPCQR